MQKYIFLFFLISLKLTADDINPYLQGPTDTSVIINWETETDTVTELRFGQQSLSQVISGAKEILANGRMWHTVRLNNLSPETTYRYQIKTEFSESAVYTFNTLPESGIRQGHIRLIVRSDPQTYYNKATDIVNAITAKLHELYGTDWLSSVDLVFTDGDIVGEGWDLSAYQREYFGPLQPLSPFIPAMTAIGNHEAESPYYYQYVKYDEFAGPQGEAYYTFKLGTIQIIVLNSNVQWENDEQIEWLEQKLAEAEQDEGTDWVFTFCHHPGKSSIWTPGNTAYIQDRVIPALLQCEKAEFLINGHTHAYERGQVIDGSLRLMIAGGAGGNLDRWGDNLWADYPEHQFNFDHYHWVLFDFDLAAKSYSFQTYSLGHLQKPLNNIIIDSLTVKKEILAGPARPEPAAINDSISLPVNISGGIYSGAAPMLASQFQISTEADHFDLPLMNHLQYSMDYFLDSGAPEWNPINQSAGKDITACTVTMETLPLPGNYIWRVRYRDEQLTWSDWSHSQKLTVYSTGYSLPEAPNKSYIFNGKDSYLSITDQLSNATLPERYMTVETWVKLKTSHTWGGFIGAFEDNGGYEKGWVLGNYSNKFSFGLATSGPNDGDGFMTYLSASSSFQTDLWYHVAASFNGADMKLYVNGRLAGTSTSQWGTIYYDSDSYFDIGIYHDDNEFNVLNGEMDEVRLWAATLNLETIQNWMHQDISDKHPNYDQLISYWNLNELNAGQFKDQRGGNHATTENLALAGYVASDVPVGDSSLFLAENKTITLGKSGAMVKVTPVKTINESNYLGLYLIEDEEAYPVKDAALPIGLHWRSARYWGIREYGSCQASLIFGYDGIGHLPAADSLHLLFRPNARTAWEDITEKSINNTTEGLFEFESQTEFGEYSIAWNDKATTFKEEPELTPAEFSVKNNYPNPFNSVTTFIYNLPSASDFSVEIYNLLGELVYHSKVQSQSAGQHQFQWHGRGTRQSEVPSGVYLVRFTAGSAYQHRKVIFVK